MGVSSSQRPTYVPSGASIWKLPRRSTSPFVAGIWTPGVIFCQGPSATRYSPSKYTWAARALLACQLLALPCHKSRPSQTVYFFHFFTHVWQALLWFLPHVVINRGQGPQLALEGPCHPLSVPLTKSEIFPANIELC